MLIIDTKAAGSHTGFMTAQAFMERYISSSGKKVLYVHTPFCPAKCRYCICQSVACPDRSTVDEYARETLIPQIRAAAPVFEAVAFDEVYFGGGTPTYISPDALKEVFEAIPGLRAIPVKSIEGSPNTLQTEHVELLKEYAFDFLSVGVQSLQPDVCSWQNRFCMTAEQVQTLSDYLRNSGIYFNYDLITYLGRGDFRDIPGFEADLHFLMSQCRPSSINIHQLHQTTYTTEKMLRLYQVLRGALEQYPEYECINARLLDSDAYDDIVYQAQYRFVRERREFTHYMWNKYPEIPVLGYDIFSVGYTDRITPKSNAGTLVYKPGTGAAKTYTHNEELYRDYHAIRREKGLE